MEQGGKNINMKEGKKWEEVWNCQLEEERKELKVE